MVLWQAGHVEDAVVLGYELAFCEGSFIRIDKEWSRAVCTKGDKTQNCSNWAEAGPGVTHNNV